MTRYQYLIDKAEACLRRAHNARGIKRAVLAKRYYALVRKARSLTLKEAAEAVR